MDVVSIDLSDTGIATELLELQRRAYDVEAALIGSHEPSATRAIVQTGVDNEPAKALYLREGFEQTEELEVPPGLRIARLSQRLR